MATNDWEKSGEWNNSHRMSVWYKDKNTRVIVWKTAVGLKEMKKRGHIGTYIFKATGEEKKYFRTKLEALKHARAYMRKH